MFFFYSPNKNCFKITLFPKTVYIKRFQETEVTVSSAAPGLTMCESAMLLFLTVGIRSYGICLSSTAKVFIPRLAQFVSLVQKLKRGDLHREVCYCEEERWIKIEGKGNEDKKGRWTRSKYLLKTILLMKYLESEFWYR
jgi:hypothetical protein